MSTFNGVLNEYPSLRIDYFEVKNELETRPLTFFLSHCHADHMVGLGSNSFFDYLRDINKSCKISMYTSWITKKLLTSDRKYARLEPYIVNLPLQEPTTIQIPNETGEVEDVLVTLIPSGHCPGSVMFLFEGHGGTVLYTGDFRLSVGDVTRFTYLHTADGIVKHIDSLYIDTTFCIPEAAHLPSRQESLDRILTLIETWLSKAPQCVVWLDCKTQYGYEHIFVAIRKSLGIKVHVSMEKMERYRGIPEIENAVTSDGRNTRVHSCGYPPSNFPSKFDQLPCHCKPHGNADLKIFRLKPSCLWFTMHPNLARHVDTNINKNASRVCYSMHSSLIEARDFVNHLKPKLIHANVVPEDKSELEILKLLKSGLDFDTEGNLDREDEPVLLGELKKAQPLGVGVPYNSDDPIYSFDSLDERKSQSLSEEQSNVTSNYKVQGAEIAPSKIEECGLLEDPSGEATELVKVFKKKDSDPSSYSQEEISKLQQPSTSSLHNAIKQMHLTIKPPDPIKTCDVKQSKNEQQECCNSVPKQQCSAASCKSTEANYLSNLKESKSLEKLVMSQGGCNEELCKKECFFHLPQGKAVQDLNVSAFENKTQHVMYETKQNNPYNAVAFVKTEVNSDFQRKEDPSLNEKQEIDVESKGVENLIPNEANENIFPFKTVDNDNMKKIIKMENKTPENVDRVSENGTNKIQTNLSESSQSEAKDEVEIIHEIIINRHNLYKRRKMPFKELSLSPDTGKKRRLKEVVIETDFPKLANPVVINLTEDSNSLSEKHCNQVGDCDTTPDLSPEILGQFSFPLQNLEWAEKHFDQIGDSDTTPDLTPEKIKFKGNS